VTPEDRFRGYLIAGLRSTPVSIALGGEAAGAVARDGALGHSRHRARRSDLSPDRGSIAGHRDGCSHYGAANPGPQRQHRQREINAAFATFVRERPDALFVGTGPFLANRRVQLVHLATRHAVPAVYSGRQYSEVGGLMTYGPNIVDAFRQMGVHTGRILKGAKPADLPDNVRAGDQR
jgi:hypothetical protein